MKTINLKLVLEFETGIKESGDAIYTNVTLSNLRHDLTSEELYEIALAFDSLVNYPLIDIRAVYTQQIREVA